VGEIYSGGMKSQKTTGGKGPMKECFFTGVLSFLRLFIRDLMRDMRTLEVITN